MFALQALCYLCLPCMCPASTVPEADKQSSCEVSLYMSALRAHSLTLTSSQAVRCHLLGVAGCLGSPLLLSSLELHSGFCSCLPHRDLLYCDVHSALHSCLTLPFSTPG